VNLQRTAKFIENFQRKESDLTFVIVLEIEVSITANTTPRHTFYLGHFNHRMRVRFAAVMANKIVARGNEQVTNFHRTHATIEAVTLTLNSIEVPFFRRLDEHFFALQTIFGVPHVRCGNVCLKTRFVAPFHVQ